MKRGLLLLCIFCMAVPFLFAEDRGEQRSWDWDVSVEFNQMLHSHINVEFLFNKFIGIKAGLGSGFGGITCYSYSFQMAIHLNLPVRFLRIDIELGLPHGYFDFLEGEVVDWNEIIDDPYYGFLPGGGILIMFRIPPEHYIGLRFAATVFMEYQRDSGWKEPSFMPFFALVYNF